MAYPIEVFDYEISTDVPPGASTVFTVGGNWEPGDIRLHFYAFSINPSSTGTISLTPPTGVTKISSVNATAPALAWGLYHEILTSSSQDRTAVITGTGGNTLTSYFYAACTLRNAYQIVLTQANSARAIYTQGSGTASTATVAAKTGVTTPGVDVMFGSALSAGVQALSGYTQLIDSGNSGANYGTASSDNGLCIQAKTLTSGTSVPASTFNYNGAVILVNASAYVQQAPDVSVTVGQATTETDTANAATGSLLNKVTFPVQTAVAEVDTANQVFSPLTGFRVSNPVVLPGFPVSASRITWRYDTFAVGSKVHVLTSIDNGATWQEAANGAAVPLLLPGNTTATTVLTKVIIERALMTDPTPRVYDLELDIACDAPRNEMVSQGVFLVEQTDITITGGTTGGGSGSGGGGDGVTGSGGGNAGGGLSIEVTGTDLSLAVSRNAWTDVMYIPYGTSYADAIQLMIIDRLPDAQFNFVTTVETTPQLIFGTEQGNNPWQDAQDLAAAIGHELYFDPNGICTLEPIPDARNGTPVWEFDDGDSPVLVNFTRSLNDQTTYNYIVVTGESSSNTVPVSAIAYDNDPNSPTYIGGPYGRKAYFWQSPTITTTDQAQAAANSLLQVSLGVSDTSVLTVVPMPALEPGDVVAVNVSQGKANGNYLINSIVTPISPAEAQEITVYRQQ